MEEDRNDDLDRYVAACPECQTGVLHRRYLTYFTWLDRELITVQNFPAWVCDMCGRREYDTQAIRWLNAMLNPDAGKSSRHRGNQRPDQDGDLAHPG